MPHKKQADFKGHVNRLYIMIEDHSLLERHRRLCPCKLYKDITFYSQYSYMATIATSLYVVSQGGPPDKRKPVLVILWCVAKQ